MRSQIPEGSLSFLVTFTLPPDHQMETRVTVVAENMTEAITKFKQNVPDGNVKSVLSNRYIVYI